MSEKKQTVVQLAGRRRERFVGGAGLGVLQQCYTEQAIPHKQEVTSQTAAASVPAGGSERRARGPAAMLAASMSGAVQTLCWPAQAWLTSAGCRAKLLAPRLRRFDGKGNWQAYLVLLNFIAEAVGWSWQEKGVNLAASLEGDALQALLDINEGEPPSSVKLPHKAVL
ncbi:hypothetical protein SKAU_G00022060 [Synaphobranchus kaupii]|uniref:Uncharacterized protein n=1 Tax=Synaphobranchus kaupii TaxID=118154 RepID=A0A9Q1GD17_SYNKA|nr:hypothetical protein SKAU_G00022060 [Synaphobranchus kaupii]